MSIWSRIRRNFNKRTSIPSFGTQLGYRRGTPTKGYSKPIGPSRPTPSQKTSKIKPKPSSPPSRYKPSRKRVSIKPKPFDTTSTLTRYTKPTGLAGASATISEKAFTIRRRIQTKKARPLDIPTAMALTSLQTLVETGIAIKDLPKTTRAVIDDPSLLLQLPGAVRKELVSIGVLAKTSPHEAVAKIGTEIVLIKGTGTAISKANKLSKAGLAKLSTKYAGKLKLGSKIKIPTSKGKSVTLTVVDRIPKQTLRNQAKLIGKRVTAISSQADDLLTLMKKKRIIRKPIPGEKGFNLATKKLLKKFDAGKITKKEVLVLDKAIQKQGAKGLLERAFFADPTRKVRPSRLGVLGEKKASVTDILTGDITFKQSKPQILLFEDIKVSKLPKKLLTIKNKLSKGVGLTTREADDLLKFQLKKSGKFKPIGFVSGESEISLAPGEIIKKVKKVGSVGVKGRVVPIIKTEVLKPTGRLKTLLNKFNKGKLTSKETKSLSKLVKKETGFNYKLSSYKTGRKFVDLSGVKISSTAKISKAVGKGISKPISKPKPKPSPKPKLKPTKSKPTKKIKKPTKSRPSKGKPSKRKPVSVSKPKYKPKPSKRKPYKPYKYSRSRPSKPSRKSPYRPSKKRPYKTSYRRKKPVSKRPYKPSKPSKPAKPYKPYKPARPGKPAKPFKPAKLPKTKYKPRRRRVKKVRSYIIQEKRGRKFVTLKTKPLSLKSAKDKLAYRIDNKISRTARIIPSKKTKRLFY